MTHSFLGCHWMRMHQENWDWDHIGNMQYGSYTLFQWMWSDRDFCNRLLERSAPNAIFLCRHHGRSEQKQQMYANPKSTGIIHAEEWAKDVDENFHLPIERVKLLGINEPNTNHAQQATNEYETWRLRRMNELGLPAGVWCFGTGHPSTVDLRPENKPDWTWYESSYGELKRGNHIGVVHEYGLPHNYMWGNNCDRLQWCPLDDIEFVIQECGVDGGTGGRPGDGYVNFNMTETEYADWLQGYMDVMMKDKRVHSVHPFTYDFAHPWSSFDVRPMAPTLEARWAGGRGIERTDSPVQPPTPPPPPTPPTGFDPFTRAMEFIGAAEGGYQDDPNDPGNWTGGKKGVGENKGTNWGISAASYPHLDIRNLTKAEATHLFRTDFWEPSGAARQPWPFALMVLDTDILHGLGTSAHWLADYGPDPYAFAWRRQRVYALSDNAPHFAQGWTNRLDRLMVEVT